jgi:aspartyl-tRNA(Asn)/glutamyl-tRNA(Gln) amidotransferase subunit A
MRPNTVVLGNLARSVRDAARYFDVVSGPHPGDPSSLPKHPGFEAGLGSHDLAGRRFAVVPALGGVTLEPGVEDHIRAEADHLAKITGMTPVEIDLRPPNLAAQWMMGNLATLLADLDGRWPRCADDMTTEVAMGLYISQALYNLRTAAAAEALRVEVNEAMAAAFAEVDFVVCATNPGPAFDAEATTSSQGDSIADWLMDNTAARYGLRGALMLTQFASVIAPGLPNRILDRAATIDPDLVTMGALTIVSNIYGNPAVSIPAGTIDGLPIGMQVLGRHHTDELLFDVALAVERERPWPLVAPAVHVAARADAASPA